MKRLLCTVAALGFAAGAASAADLPSRRVAPAPVVPVFTWTGFYVGVNAGYGFGEFSKGAGFDDPDGFIGGGQIGYNYQFGQFVAGLEADIQYADLKGSTSALRFANGNVGRGRGEVEYFGTVRGRVGVAFDRALVYVTGGLAYGETKFSGVDTTAGIAFSKSDTRTGWTLGGGIEYAFTNNLTARAEYLYVDLGDNRYYGVNKAGTEFSVVRAGLNYKF
ncbi:porin family protein [Chelatococcus sp. SYSU_G07232]|uniref:Porin family protein n=1 Tax=Chelatococcus albus TaxID=3047466 RepID=A0ABT7AKV9_9HYPH|nr:outer membrane protein [Chelatococcus sp. SYSU_G07232]MDJ1160011.1 porin family protein [Chelatococcus sp. SYSU_G07232]